MEATHRIHITATQIEVDGHLLDIEGEGSELLKNAYRMYIGSYPKFFKMDILCRLGFVASEILLQQEGERHFDEKGRVLEEDSCEDRAIILFNRYASLSNDENYQATIQQSNNYYPSPSVFVYTLPNIVTGEIAIRNRYYGESNFIVMPKRDEQMMQRVIKDAFFDVMTKSIITGWLDSDDCNHFEADLYIINRI